MLNLGEEKKLSAWNQKECYGNAGKLYLAIFISFSIIFLRRYKKFYSRALHFFVLSFSIIADSFFLTMFEYWFQNTISFLRLIDNHHFSDEFSICRFFIKPRGWKNARFVADEGTEGENAVFRLAHFSNWSVQYRIALIFAPICREVSTL